jgi:hypothetical protein
MKVYDGAAWAAAYLPAAGYLPISGGTMTGNLYVNAGTDSRVLLQVSGTTQAQFQATASAIRLASNGTIPLVFATDGVDRVTFDNLGNVTFGSASASGVFKVQGSNAGDLVVFESTDASGSAAPDVVLYRNSASPAAADQVGVLVWRGKDSGAADQQYARIGAEIISPTAGSESGSIWFETVNAGTSAERFRFGSAGQFGIGGANYGTSGQAMLSGGASAAPAWADVVTPTGTQTLTNKTFTGYTETVYAISGTTPSLNPANGTIQTWTLTGNSTPTAGSFAAGQSMTIMVDDGSAYTITWPSVTWKTDSGSAPTLNTTGYTAVQLWKVGSTLYGARVGNN